MTKIGIGRRLLLVALVAGVGATACTGVPVPKMGPGPPNVGVRSAIKLGPAPIKGDDAKFAFVEIAGAPARHIIDFNRALESEAESRNLNIVPVGDPSATYLVKGYLSAIGDRSGTFLVFVWDVTDTNGTRLHRVTGKEPGGGSGTDPWLGIDGEPVRLAARQTIDDLAAWSR